MSATFLILISTGDSRVVGDESIDLVDAESVTFLSHCTLSSARIHDGFASFLCLDQATVSFFLVLPSILRAETRTKQRKMFEAVDFSGKYCT